MERDEPPEAHGRRRVHAPVDRLGGDPPLPAELPALPGLRGGPGLRRGAGHRGVPALPGRVAAFAKPIIILTGGEPMAREDIYRLAEHGTSLGLRMVMAPCGLLMDTDSTRRIVAAGIRRISLSIDGADRETHDSFRRVEGAFDSVLRAARLAREQGLEFQVNTTVTRLNVGAAGEDPRAGRFPRRGGLPSLPAGAHRAGQGAGRSGHRAPGVRAGAELDLPAEPGLPGPHQADLRAPLLPGPAPAGAAGRTDGEPGARTA